ncbi:MAG: nuclear transport factor 2 family protein [Hyphomonadaceae bacterium]|nr:nuclear transport factor 2 family protein [Hyphomonadaceae bacterium]
MAEAQTAKAGDRTFGIIVYAAQFFFGGWFLYNGLNYFIEFFPQPHGSSAISRELIGALMHSGMFAVVKAIEVVVGVALLANRFVPLAAVLGFPVTYSIAHLNIVANGDAFSIGVGIVFTALNALIALGRLDRFLPMLAFDSGDPSAAGLRTFLAGTGTAPAKSAMRPLAHLACIVAGLLAPIGVEAWTTSPIGPRSQAHYAAVANASKSARDVALAFDRLVFDEGKPQEAAERFLAPDIADHISSARGARASMVAMLRGGAWPDGVERTLRHVVSEGDVVMMHYDLRLPGDVGAVPTVEIFRVSSGRIVEHWSIAEGAASAPTDG